MSAADSLILADVVELLGGGVTSSHPLCVGAQMTLTPGYDRGAPQPVTDIVASLLLDGERPIGRRSGDRTISLPIKITAPDRPTLNGARELLQQLTDQDTWRLTWTPDPGPGSPLPLVFDCFRATATPGYDGDLEDQLVTYTTLTFPALPFGRSDTLTTLVFPSPAVSWPQPANPVKLDDYSTVASTTQATWWSQSVQHVSDNFSAHWTYSLTDQVSGPFYTKTLPSPLDITGLNKFSFQFGLGTSNYSRWRTGNVTFAITLTDNASHTLSFGGVAYCTASNNTSLPTWTPVTFAIPTSATFDYTHVNAYSIHAWRFVDRSQRLVLDSDAYLNGLTAIPGAVSPFAAVRGTLYQLGAPGGTARAPMSAQFQARPVTPPVQASVTFNTPGPWSWTPPPGASVGKVRVKGGQGKGGDRTSAGAGGGGGGGADIGEDLYPLVPGQPVGGYIGAGGGTGGQPTLFASYYVNQDGRNYSPLVTPSFTPASGEVLIVKAEASDAIVTFNTPTGGGLTFTSRVNIGTQWTTGRAAVYTATVGGGGTPMTVTLTVSGPETRAHAMVVERWTNAKLAGSPAVLSSAGSGAPSGTCTTAANNSVVTWVNTDYNTSGGAHTYRSSAVEQASNVVDVANYFAYQAAATAGAQTCGMTSPSGQAWQMAGVEVQAFNVGALTDGQPSSFDGGAGVLTAPGGSSVPVNTATGGAAGTPAITALRAFLTTPQTDFETGTGTWVAGTNCAIAQTAAQAHAGTKSLQLTSTGAGDMTAQHVSVANTDTAAGLPVLAGGLITVSAWFRSAVSARTVQPGATFVDVNGAAVGSGVYTAGGADSAAAWTQYSGTITVPANAAWAALSTKVVATAAGAEVHYVDDAQIYPGAVWAGGAGATGSTTGGGGGSSAGDDAVGVAGSGQTGGTAPTGGISGGNGGAAGGNNAGSSPGGGSFSTGGSVSGAAGSAGKVQIWYNTPPTAFKTLLAHAPSYAAPATLNPLMPVGAGIDPPDGREYQITSPITGLNARFYGTYTILAIASTVNTPSASRVITVTFKQYDYLGGPSSTRTVVRTLTPSTETPPIANGFIVVGEITLPVRDIATDNTASYTTVGINSTNSSDRFLDVLALDVRGQLAAINISGTGYVNFYLDAPDIDRDWGRVLGSAFDRAQATSVLDANDLILSGGPLVIDPSGPGWLLAYSPDAGAPGLTATFYARWRDSRLS